MILAGGAGTRLTVLSEERAKPAVPFAGKFRIIDFTLSNCVNSGIFTVGVLTQYRPHSLNEHIGIGKPWDLDRARGGVRLLQPYQRRRGSEWYGGTADAISQNIEFLQQHRADTALILSGDHIYKMDYTAMIAQHRATGADLTIGVMPVPLEETDRYGIMQVNREGRITNFFEKPKARDKGNLASMGIYVFDTHMLERRLTDDEGKARMDFGHDVIPAMRRVTVSSPSAMKDIGWTSARLTPTGARISPCCNRDPSWIYLRTSGPCIHARKSAQPPNWGPKPRWQIA